MISSHKLIKELFKQWSGENASEIKQLPESGSNRVYYRVSSPDKHAIATYNPDRAENEAFVYINKKLKKAGVNVPTIYVKDLDNNIYLQQDLGSTDLFQKVSDGHQNGTTDYIDRYKQVIRSMPDIQYNVSRDFDFSICYPRLAFDKQSMLWDLNYFKYHFLKLAYTPFHEQKLEDDFRAFVNFLTTSPSYFFLYRDFQSRNIMIYQDKVYFIDYQGGRKGALQYDLASLLFESKTSLSIEQRNDLLNYYIEVFGEYPFFDKKVFLKYYPGFILIRMLQAFGAYGYRGYFERKPYFLQSIPPAIENLEWLLANYDLGVKLPHLISTLKCMVSQPVFHVPHSEENKLTITIHSFSFRKGIPEDYSGNGGGFVFDCRSLPNPGRYEEYKAFTGLDQKVIEYLEDKPEINKFIQNTSRLIGSVIENYRERKFTQLAVNFGCTGGQHRSVYSSEKISAFIRTKYPDVIVVLHHRELEKEKYDQINV